MSCQVKTFDFAAITGLSVGAIVGISELIAKSKGGDPYTILMVGAIASASISFVSALLVRTFLDKETSEVLTCEELDGDLRSPQANCSNRLITIGTAIISASFSAIVATVFAVMVGKTLL